MLRFIKISLLTLVLAVSLVGSPVESLRTASAVCPVGDLSGDCEVDLPDLLVFAEQWLEADSSGVDLVAHWKLDGNADDLIGGNHGTVYGNPVWTIGQLDGALYFDGVGDFVDCGNDSSVNLTNNFSISTWFNLNDAGQALPICKGNVTAYASGGAYSFLCVPANGIFAFYLRGSNNTEYAYATTTVPLSEWTHIVGTFSNRNINIYRNGSFADDGVLGTSTINTNNGPLAIGAEGDGGMSFDGMIDDVRIYNRALTEAEAEELTNLGVPDPNSADLDDNGNVNLFDFTLLAENWHEEGTPLVINEFMASNSSGSDINDPQGDHDDWLEIYNTGNVAVDIGGMYITDNLSNPTKCRIPDDSPNDTTISPYGHLVIWADEDSEDGPLHVEFKLSSGGDEIGLFDTDGNTLVDSIIFDDQVADISYGRYPDSGDMWRFMGFPTPEAQNNAGYLGQVADTEFSHDRGFYDVGFNATITCDTPDAVIRYTPDGSTPTDTYGIVYVAAIPIGTTTCLRAGAFKPGYLSSNVDTHTYIFLDDVIRQATDPGTGAQVIPPGFPTTWDPGPGDPPYENWATPDHRGDYQVDPDVVGQDGTDIFGGLYADTIKDDLQSVPTISLVMDRDDWFGSEGIYIHESQDHTERVASFEFMDPSTSREAQINCAMSMQGGGAGGGTSLQRWKTYKCSMRPRFKIHTDDGEHTGGLTRLNFKLFADSPIERYDTVVIDGVLNHSWLHGWSSSQRETAMYIQDQYVSDLHNAMGGYSPYGHYAHIYINGLYWGMYYIHDRPDHAWAAEMFGGDKDEYDAIKHSTTYVINDGGGFGSGTARASFNDMIDAADDVSSDPTNPDKYDALCQMLDVDNFIKYLLSNWFCGTTDWPHKNWYATHLHPNGLWRFHTWDAEHTLEGASSFGSSPYSIHDKLDGNAEYRLRFADLAHRYLFNNGVLSHPNPADMYQARMDQVDRAIVGESARWGDNRESTPYTRQDWLNTQDNKLISF
ncbi:MAG: LamG-like jellyroll fold domain-containing protein, partial [Planctomycetota bacterium]